MRKKPVFIGASGLLLLHHCLSSDKLRSLTFTANSMILTNHREPFFNFAAPYLQLPTGDGSLPSHESSFRRFSLFSLLTHYPFRESVSNERDLIDCRLTPLAILDKPFFDDIRSPDGFKRVKFFSARIFSLSIAHHVHHHTMIRSQTHLPIFHAREDRLRRRSQAPLEHRFPH